MIFQEVIDLFKSHQDEGKAYYMAKYMKDQFPFLGLAKPLRIRLQAETIRRAKQQPDVDWDGIFYLWNQPEREFQYLAMDYLQAIGQGIQGSDLNRICILITSKSWWDTVDMLASNIVGPLLARHPDLKERNIQIWMHSDNLWLVRTAILFQLKYKKNTDTALLGNIIAANCGTRVFFTNKAIGWALREYSKTDPDWVREFLNHHRLHSLSVREASKYL